MLDGDWERDIQIKNKEEETQIRETKREKVNGLGLETGD